MAATGIGPTDPGAARSLPGVVAALRALAILALATSLTAAALLGVGALVDRWG